MVVNGGMNGKDNKTSDRKRSRQCNCQEGEVRDEMVLMEVLRKHYYKRMLEISRWSIMMMKASVADTAWRNMFVKQ